MSLDLNEIAANNDAAKRISETVSLHLMAAKSSDILDIVGRWCVFSLEDGKSDGKTYESKDEAIRFKEPWEKRYCYLKITPDGITIKDAMHFLRINRHPMIDVTAPEHKINRHLFKPSATVVNTTPREGVDSE